MKGLLDRFLGHVICTGSLRVEWSDGTATEYGDGGSPSATLVLRDPKVANAIVRNPELALGEAYMDGKVDFPDNGLTAFLTLINDNWTRLRSSKWVGALAAGRYIGEHFLRRNGQARARTNVAHHYDLDERL